LKDVFYVPTITKKINLGRLDGGTRFIGDIQPEWMLYGRHEDPRQIDYKREKEWMNVHLGCQHA
jgi:hypothetical protein